MSENPPSPAPDDAREPPPPASPDYDPTRSGKAGFPEIAGRGCLGLVTFLIAVVVFTSIMLANRPAGLLVSTGVVVGLILWRRRVGPSPLLGAVVIGAGIALAITGTCTLIFMNADFR